jgi:hypothetical protein
MTMPLYADVHKQEECPDKDTITEARQPDAVMQAKHGVTYLHYWLDGGHGEFHCLINAPSKEAVIAVHCEAYGLAPESIVEI